MVTVYLFDGLLDPDPYSEYGSHPGSVQITQTNTYYKIVKIPVPSHSFQVAIFFNDSTIKKNFRPSKK